MKAIRVTRPAPTVRYNGSEAAKADLLEPKNDEHVWATYVIFVHTAESMRAGMTGTEQVHMDMENIAMLTNGCFICEQPWSERLAHRKCPGEPKE